MKIDDDEVFRPNKPGLSSLAIWCEKIGPKNLAGQLALSLGAFPATEDHAS